MDSIIVVTTRLVAGSTIVAQVGDILIGQIGRSEEVYWASMLCIISLCAEDDG